MKDLEEAGLNYADFTAAERRKRDERDAKEKQEREAEKHREEAVAALVDLLDGCIWDLQGEQVKVGQKFYEAKRMYDAERNRVTYTVEGHTFAEDHEGACHLLDEFEQSN